MCLINTFFLTLVKKYVSRCHTTNDVLNKLRTALRVHTATRMCHITLNCTVLSFVRVQGHTTTLTPPDWDSSGCWADNQPVLLSDFPFVPGLLPPVIARHHPGSEFPPHVVGWLMSVGLGAKFIIIQDSESVDLCVCVCVDIRHTLTCQSQK